MITNVFLILCVFLFLYLSIRWASRTGIDILLKMTYIVMTGYSLYLLGLLNHIPLIVIKGG